MSVIHNVKVYAFQRASSRESIVTANFDFISRGVCYRESL